MNEMEEGTEGIHYEKCIHVNVDIQLHFTLDNVDNEEWPDDKDMIRRVTNVVRRQLLQTNDCDQFVVNKTIVEDHNLIIRYPPKNPTLSSDWVGFVKGTQSESS